MTDEYWAVLEDELDADQRGWRQTGSSAFAQEQLMESSRSSRGLRAVISVCVDLSHTGLIDRAGNTIAAPDQRLIFPMEVTVEGENPETLLVADAVSMEADEACGE